jgi:signal transduction histidine kinase
MSSVAILGAARAFVVAAYAAISGYLLYNRRNFPLQRTILVLALYILSRAVCLAIRSSAFQSLYVALEVISSLAGVALAVALVREIPSLLAESSHEAGRRTDEAIDAKLRKVTELERQKIEAQFMANVSHDLRTPIAAIRGYSETLLKGGLEDDRNRADFVRIIQRNAERIGSLVENLLALTTVDAAQTKRLAIEIELGSFVDDVVADLAPASRRRHVEVVNEVDDGLTVEAQDQQLWQILQNLIGNAIKFTPRDGRVSVRARAMDRGIEISVADTGPGIDPAQLPLLFDRFHMRRQGKPIEKGSGLGLTIVRALVEAHGGKVSVDSHPGIGSTFRFTLPRAAEPVKAVV